MKATDLPTISITPAVHLEFIQNQLQNPAGSAPQEIEEYHRAVFLHHHAVEWEKLRQDARTRQERIGFLEGQLKEVHVRLGKRPRLTSAAGDGMEQLRPSAPWNGWDIAMFLAAALGIVCLITFGVLNISFNLLESGFITFHQSPLRSYLWSALLPVGALAVKIGWDFLAEQKARQRYLWFCLALGLAGVLAWLVTYACVYPTLSKGIDEQLASLTVFDSPNSATTHLNFAGTKWVDAVTVAAQAVAEIFLSAVLGMHMTVLYARHRPVRLAKDPAYAQLDEERCTLEERLAKERLALGEATGSIVRLENQLSALLAYGKSLFHREAARREEAAQKRQVILDQLSDHLRQHIEGGEPNRRFPSTETALPGKNGG